MKEKPLLTKSRNLSAFLKAILLFLLVIFAGVTTMIQAQTVTITTDKLDYFPGEWVTITGSGWQAEEFVMLTLTHTGDFIPEHTHLPFNVQANSAGDIYYQWYVSDAELGTAFLLTAEGLSSGWEAEATFTDSQVNAISPTTGTTGTNFTIDGTGFGAGPFEACFNTSPNPTCVDLTAAPPPSKELFGVIPDLPAGVYSITVYNKNDHTVGNVLDNEFTFCTNVSITNATATLTPICPDATTTITANGVVGTNSVLTWWTEAGGNGTNLGNDNPLIVGPGTYYARVTGDCGDPVEAIVTVGSKDIVGITDATAAESPICPDATTTVTANGVVGTNAVLTWWTEAGGNGSNLGNDNPLTVGPGTYYARVTGDCGDPVEAIVTVGSKDIVGITDATAAESPICPDATTTVTANGVVGTNAVLTWWTEAGGNGSNLGNDNPLTVGPGTYYARITGDCGDPVEAMVTVGAKDVVGITDATAADSPICPDATTTITANGVFGTNAVLTWWTGTGGSGTDLGHDNPLTVGPGTYYAYVTGDCGDPVEASVAVDALKATIITTPPASIDVVYGCDAPILTVVADGEGTLTYQWYKNTTNSNSGGTAIIGARSSSYQTPHNYNVGHYYYYVVVTAGCGSVNSDVAVVSITPQTAMAVGDIYYTGPTMAWTTSPTSNTATVTLSATIKNGEPCGDIRTARITFTVNGQPIPSAQNLPVDFIDPNYPEKGGTASAIVQLNIANTATSDIFDIGVIISGNYTAGNFVPGDVTIIKPKPGGVIGGGAFLCNSNSTGYVKGSLVSYLNFFVEYAVKGKSITNPKGKVNLIVASRNKPDGTIDTKLHWYSIKSNAIASLNITSPTATFSGKANIAELNILTGVSTAIEGNCVMVLDLKDISLSGQPNFSDLVGITIQRNGGGIWYSNNWISTKTVAANICGGDITVTGSPASLKITEVAETITPNQVEKGRSDFKLEVYPNPAAGPVNFRFTLEENSKVILEIFTISGKLVDRIFEADVEQGIEQTALLNKPLPEGVYIYRLVYGNHLRTGKIIKTVTDR